jgi:hypothetical protein
MLAILVGARAEHNGADRHIEILERSELNSGYVISRGTFGDKPVLVCRTGLGEERVKGIADEIIHEHPVSAILSPLRRPARGSRAWGAAAQVVGKRSYVSAWAMLRQNLAHPRRLPNFLRLVDAVRVSCRSLSPFFTAFLSEGEWRPLPSRAPDQR